jgi:hypothetical protein
MSKYDKYYQKFLSYKAILQDDDKTTSLSVDCFDFFPNKNEYLHSNNIHTIGDVLKLNRESIKHIFFGKFSSFHKICNTLKSLCAKDNPVLEGNDCNVYERILLPLFNELSTYSFEQLAGLELPFTLMDSPRLENGLRRCSITTYNDLKNYGIKRTSKIRNLGKQSFKDLNRFCLNDLSTHTNRKSPGWTENGINQWSTFIIFAKEQFNNLQKNPVVSEIRSKDYSLYREKLRTLIYENSNKFLTARENSIFLRRFNPEKKETLDSIGKAYNLTRERIRQIELKCIRKIGSKMSSPKICEQFEFVSQFYTCLTLLGSEDFVSYLSFSAAYNDLDWLVLKYIFSKNLESMPNIPKYNKPLNKNPALAEKRKKARLVNEEKRNLLISSLSSDLFTDKEILIMKSIHSLSSVRKVTDKKLFRFITGAIDFYSEVEFFGCLKEIKYNEFQTALTDLTNRKIIKKGFYKGNVLLYLDYDKFESV